VSAKTNMIKYDPNIFASKISWRHALIDHRAVPRHPPQGLTQSVRGSRDVIEEPKLLRFSELLTEVKSKKLVLQRARGEVQKPDLTFDTEAGISILDMLFGQPGLLQKRLWLDPSRLRPFAGKARDHPGCSRDRAETLWFEVVHGSPLCVKTPRLRQHVLEQ